MSARRIVVVGAGGSGIPLAVRLAEAGHEVELLEAGPGLAAAQAERSRRGPRRRVDGACWTPGRAGDVDVRRGAVPRPTVAHRPGPRRGRQHGGQRRLLPAAASTTSPSGPPSRRRMGLGGVPARAGADSRTDLDFPDDPVHGTTGPMPVARAGADDPATRAFLAAAVAAGAVAEHDKNAGGLVRRAGLLPRNAVGALRWDVGRAYAERLAAASVTVRTAARVERVRFRAGRAIGVEIRDGDGTVFVPADEVVLRAPAPSRRRACSCGRGWGMPPHRARHRPRGGPPRRGSRPDRPPGRPAVVARPGRCRGRRADRGVDRGLERAGGHCRVGRGGVPRRGGCRRRRSSPGTPRRTDRSTCASRWPARGRAERSPSTTPRSATATWRTPPISRRCGPPCGRGAACCGRRRWPTSSPRPTSPSWVDERDADAAADAWIRAHLGTALHSCGTARMGAEHDPDAVADAHGRVHGVEALRVADASPAAGGAVARHRTHRRDDRGADR